MSRLQVPYDIYDKTGDPAATSRARHAPQFSRDLDSLGFQPIGVLEAHAKSRERYAETVRGSMNEQDADLMIKFVNQGEAVEITRAPDGQAFGVVERSVSGAVVCLETLLENGIILETTMRPARAPRPAKPMDSNIRVISWLLRLTATPPLWPRRNVPGAGFFVELVDTRDVLTLYERHQVRVTAIKARSRTVIPCHDNLDLYKAIRLRTVQVAAHLKQISDASGILVIALLLPLIFLGVFWQQGTEAISRAAMTFIIVLTALLVSLVVFSLSQMIAPYIPARLMPICRLLELQRQEWGLVDYDLDMDGR